MKLSSALSLVWFIPSPVNALVGITNHPYNPPCAFACGNSLSSFTLSCSSHDMPGGGGHSHGGAGLTSPTCRAGDTAYLTSLAWCMSTKCAQYGIPTSLLQKYWEEQSTKDPTVAPKWDYPTALHNVTEPPTQKLAKGDTINTTSLASQATWDTQYRTMVFLEGESAYESRYGVALLLKPYLVYPSLIGSYQVRPLPYLLGNGATVGQSLYIILMFILNIVLTSVNYKSTQPAPHAWFPTQRNEILGLIFYRTGVFGLALAPLVILFAGRNNILLWLSNWSHSTFLLLHRWIARIFALQVLIHSILAVICYKESGIYVDEFKLPYWIWGIVGTVAVSIMLLTSVLCLRRMSYEVFLITHILMAVFVIAGSWKHVSLRFPTEWGYIMWLYVSCAVWFLDRLLRILRILKTGIRRSKVTEIGGDLVRVDVEGVRWSAAPGQHLYVYFPTLHKFRPWESHPFSLLPTILLNSTDHQSNSNASDSDRIEVQENSEKHSIPARNASLFRNNTTARVTMFIKKSTGLTKFLGAQENLLTLLEGPYPNNSTSSVLHCDRVLLVGGGIGITGLLPWVSAHPNVKLCWSVKQSADCLVQSMNGVLSKFGEKEVRIGERLKITEILAQEVHAGWAKIGVVVCGPGGLCDDVRAAVAVAGKREKVVFELEVDAYSW
ncbi:ferric reductase transmembrane component 4 [Amylocarpus encephaloides]|uniref:Ferric reductase transmembrane component 4 n=1 Tax=Amylocarpus encephaloides TaxID=45428 RepID=A0A9P7YK79_9HELO|nr:ferric reductase transmembrane component 4 [Amylocarpus encephaloides]